MSPSSRAPIVGVVVVLTAASLFGTLGPLSRFAYDAGMQPLAFVTWRGAIGFLATAAFVAWRIARRGASLTRPADLDGRARLSLGIAALMGFVLNLCMFIAFDRITVALALLGFYTYPVMVAAGNVALGREPLDRPRIAALVLAVIGMVAVVASQVDPTTGIRFDAIGVGLAIGAAMSQAVFVLVSRSGYRAVPADQAMAIVLAVTVACGVVVSMATGATAPLSSPIEAPSVAPLLVFAVLVAAAIPSMLFLTGIRLVGGTAAGILMLFEPVVGVLLAAWLLAEGLAPVQILGGLAILGAALILQRAAPPAGRVVVAPAVEAETDPAGPAALAALEGDGAPASEPKPSVLPARGTEG
jgi:drug/metabolite transporter (DMT)-like permease